LNEQFTRGQAWIDLFANANHKDSHFWVRGNLIKVKRGQLGWSQLTMAGRWKWSEGRVKRFLIYLKNEGAIEVAASSITTTISILNYDKYQIDEGADEGTDSEQTEEQTASRQRTYKNDKNDKNDKNTILPAQGAGGETNAIIELFKTVNPSYANLYKRISERKAVERLLKLHGREKLEKVIAVLSQSNTERYAPTITTPIQLENKYAQLEAFWVKRKREGTKVIEV